MRSLRYLCVLLHSTFSTRSLRHIKKPFQMVSLDDRMFFKKIKKHLRRNSTSSLTLLSEAARCQPTTPSHTQPEGAPQHEAIALGRESEGERVRYSRARGKKRRIAWKHSEEKSGSPCGGGSIGAEGGWEEVDR